MHEEDRVRIRIEPVRAFIWGPHDVLSAVRDLLTFDTPGARFTKAHKICTCGHHEDKHGRHAPRACGARRGTTGDCPCRGYVPRWDGKTRFMRKGSNAFPAGLTERVINFLRREIGVIAEIEDASPPFPDQQILAPSHVRRCLGGVELRDYQVDAVIEAIARRRAAIQLPTGGGKTEVGAAIVKLLRRPTLWVVHTKELLHQTVDRLRLRLNPSNPDVVGMVGAGINQPSFVTVGMIQTLSRLPEEWFRKFEVLFVDEVHHLSALTWFEVACACGRAWWRYGLSGTIETGHELRDLRLEGATGPLLDVAKTMELVDRGYLARPVIVMIDIGRKHYPSYETVRETVLPNWREDPRRLSKLGGALFRTAYEMGVMFNDARNAKIVGLAAERAAKGEKVLVLCSRIEHGHLLLTRLSRSTPVPLAWIYGKEDDASRQSALRAYKDAEGGAVMVASRVLDEGVDVPEIDVLILAGAGESYVKSIQRVGRALRVRPDKSEVLVYDFFDGWDHKGRKDYLGQHALARLDDYQGQGFEVRHVKEGHR